MNEGTLGHSGREKMESIFTRLQNVNQEIKPRACTYVTCMHRIPRVRIIFFSFSNFCFSGDLFRENITSFKYNELLG